MINHKSLIQKARSTAHFLLIIFICLGALSLSPPKAWAKKCCCQVSCIKVVTECANNGCACQSKKETPTTTKSATQDFIQHREWITKIVWEAHVLPAMMLMTESITASAMQQMLIVGSLFDAKHQLETQRLLQEMQAQAHKDYHPSEGMCTFGTNTRSLAASSRNSDFTQKSLASRAIQRQMLNGDGVSSGGQRDDSRSRMKQFKNVYCNPLDYAGGMELLCKGEVTRYNKDLNYTQTIALDHTLEIDLSEASATNDEEDIFALSANLYGPKLFPIMPENKMASEDGNSVSSGAVIHMDIRSVIAKRSVAQAAFAAQTAMRAQGGEEVQPYLEAILKEMGIGPVQVRRMAGTKPSYHMQMELLTKKLYQTPNFYAELYDKPVNIERKNVSMQAIGLMQRRDMYRSQLRTEAMTAVYLDSALEDIAELYANEIKPLRDDTKIINFDGLLD